jgi:hypothetical protein
MELKDLIVDSKTAWVDFTGLPGFSVEVANLSRKELIDLRKRCITQKFDRKTKQLTEQLNEDKFIKEFSAATIKNWKGLTLRNLENLILIDTEGRDLDDELEYSPSNAELLIANSTEFDQFINEVVFDLEYFRTSK